MPFFSGVYIRIYSYHQFKCPQQRVDMKDSRLMGWLIKCSYLWVYWARETFGEWKLTMLAIKVDKITDLNRPVIWKFEGFIERIEWLAKESIGYLSAIWCWAIPKNPRLKLWQPTGCTNPINSTGRRSHVRTLDPTMCRAFFSEKIKEIQIVVLVVR